MQIKSYRARSVQEALALVRKDLGPDAAVLHTREVSPGAMRWLGAQRQIEVIATPEGESVPSRMAPPPQPQSAPEPITTTVPRRSFPFREQLAGTAKEGLDLQEPELEALAASEASLQDWPEEVAARFLEMMRALSPDDRGRVIGAIAVGARESSTT